MHRAGGAGLRDEALQPSIQDASCIGRARARRLDGLKRMFYLLIPALILLAFMLPAADWQNNSYNTVIFGQYYNYAHLWIYQLYENWYCAAAAVLMLGISLLILCIKNL